ncbi:MAG: ABC transporter permease [Cyclobacteriaceae bacterium]|nr:ABC transporter permease [Cyclobacteriaceae bacterium]
MNKIALIIKREYLSRVTKKSFIIMSLVGPMLFGMIFVVQFWLVSHEGEQKVIEIIDESGYFHGNMEGTGTISFIYPDDNLTRAKEELKANDSYGLLYIPDIDLNNPQGITFFAEKNPSIEVQSSLEWFIKNRIEEIRLGNFGIDKQQLDEIKTNINLNVINITDAGEKEGDVTISLIVGYIAAFLIYLFIFLYGLQTLRGVIEEKTSKIVEIIISSVRPFQLMMGKIIGIGAVGLTQFVIWAILTIVIWQGALTFYQVDIAETKKMELVEGMQTSLGESREMPEFLEKINTINFPLLIGAFLFYFIGGFLFYGALFAAVGSAVDNDSDAQQFQLPITLPLILSIMLLSAIIRDPHGSLAFWSSIVPFTSPVVMMMRIPFDPPLWHIGLSMVCMIAGFIFTTWLAGRIYRIGILMHGAKVNYKVLARWFMMKN